MLTSFGEEIQQTPLQLAALMSAIANGGTLYYLQYPRSQADVAELRAAGEAPLDIGEPHPDGEARHAGRGGVRHRAPRARRRRRSRARPAPAARTTRTWAGSAPSTMSGDRKLVVVVLLTGGRPAIGPLAAGIAGDVYRRLGEKNYFARRAADDAGDAGFQPDLLLHRALIVRHSLRLRRICRFHDFCSPSRLR